MSLEVDWFNAAFSSLHIDPHKYVEERHVARKIRGLLKIIFSNPENFWWIDEKIAGFWHPILKKEARKFADSYRK